MNLIGPQCMSQKFHYDKSQKAHGLHVPLKQMARIQFTICNKYKSLRSQTQS